MAKVQNRNLRADVVVTANLFGASPATAANYNNFFIADRAYRVKKVTAVWETASSSGTLQLEKRTSTNAKGAGVSILASTISTAGTANTVNTGTLSSTLSSLELAAGDRIGLVDGGTLTSSASLVVTVVLTPLGTA